MAIVAGLTITALNQNVSTTPVGINGWFNVSIDTSPTTGGATLGGTIVTCQRSYDGITWHNVDHWTKPSEDVGFEPDLQYYTLGVLPGNFVANVRVEIGVLGSMRS